MRESVKEILSLGPEVIVLTKGSKGADAFTSTENRSTKIYRVPIKDTTGAGDCFHAAFLYGMLSNFDLQKCLDFSSAASAILIQEVGARRGLPSVVEVKKFMEEKNKEIS
jgi:sugar/nucleoside kinase (ribokinase family)